MAYKICNWFYVILHIFVYTKYPFIYIYFWRIKIFFSSASFSLLFYEWQINRIFSGDKIGFFFHTFFSLFVYRGFNYFDHCHNDSFSTKQFCALRNRIALISLKVTTSNVTLIAVLVVCKSFGAVEIKLCNLHFVYLSLSYSAK